MKRLLSVLFWSIIAAAFIGPGTVTTAASAGAQFGYTLLWALLFSTIATLVLQEASARIAVVTGMSLGQAIRKQFFGSFKGWLILLLVIGAIIFGCAAYEAGNILGGVTGAIMGSGVSARWWTLLIGGFAGIILWLGTTRGVAYFLSTVVAFMGIAFLFTAILLKPSFSQLFAGSFIPQMPAGSGLLILGLIGTTVVPYNLFLGSGIAAGQNLQELRFGLSVSIVLGGLISMGVLVVGASVHGSFTYDSLVGALSQKIGVWSKPLFAFGLCAAGLSSAITAPLAAAITAQNLFQRQDENGWHNRSWKYRGIWLTVLAVGIGFGLANIKPIPAIILAQAFNGIVLPLVAVFLLMVVNNRYLMSAKNLNSLLSNVLMGVVVAVTIIIGISNVLKAAAALLKMAAPTESIILSVSALVTLLLVYPIARTVRTLRI
ncbi:MAG: Nramp family divalent metal transporter [bacterium]